MIPMILNLHQPSVWIDFDEQVDTLYISFEKPQRADDSVMEDDGNIYHYRANDLVGITVLNASNNLNN
ncbi:MAG: DUF2283 domain-containing protein [Candidatus Marinimicrobia bacterium]|nr:DUF2283 domain-containing protein [Candidatus Neomarinimicrobiota bacterium]